MKALVNRLEWVGLFLIGTLNEGEDRYPEKMRQLALEEVFAAIAIAEVLPEIGATLAIPESVSAAEPRDPPERIIKLPM
jgi:hypothetical protein